MKYICETNDGETVYIGETPMDAFAELVDACGNSYKFSECKFYEIGQEVTTVVQPKGE
jgi:hypothetical protein